MKLYYVENGIHDLIVAQSEEEVRCFYYYYHAYKPISFYEPCEREIVAVDVLTRIDPDCYDDWDAETFDGEPYTLEMLTAGCRIVAEIEV